MAMNRVEKELDRHSDSVIREDMMNHTPGDPIPHMNLEPDPKEFARMVNRVLGTKLREVRTEMGLTQAQLAGRLGVHLMSVSQWERAERAVPLPMLYKLHTITKGRLGYIAFAE